MRAPVVRWALSGIAELLLPPLCPACSSPADAGSPFCAACTFTVDAIDHPCPRCGLSLPPPSPGAVTGPCLGCLRLPPPWASLRAPLAYAGALSVAVRRWKLGREPALTRPLAELLAPSLTRFVGAAALVPVPLHPLRLREREFNQASLLARAARRLAGSPMAVEELLDRVENSTPQSHLEASKRRDNVRRAFALSPIARARVRGRHLVLVDDVVTTGATAEACVRQLLAGGAARVDVLALARTLP